MWECQIWETGIILKFYGGIFWPLLTCECPFWETGSIGGWGRVAFCLAFFGCMACLFCEIGSIFCCCFFPHVVGTQLPQRGQFFIFLFFSFSFFFIWRGKKKPFTKKPFCKEGSIFHFSPFFFCFFYMGVHLVHYMGVKQGAFWGGVVPFLFFLTHGLLVLRNMVDFQLFSSFFVCLMHAVSILEKMDPFSLNTPHIKKPQKKQKNEKWTPFCKTGTPHIKKAK